MTPVFLQIKYFLNTVAIGLIIGIIFDFYRAMRFLIRPRKWTTDLLDIIISILFTSISFLLLLFSNWGEVRLYVFLGIGLGIVVYIRYCSKNILTLWLNWLSFLVKSVKIIIVMSLFPIRLLKTLIAFPLGLISLLLFKIYTVIKPILKKPASKIKKFWKRFLGVFHRTKKP